MVWRFLKHYGIQQARGVLEEFASAVVAFDPHAASEAQVRMMEEELNRLGNRLAEAEAELRREHQETEQLRKSYDQYLQAAQVLESRLSTETDADRTAATEVSLAKVLDKLERLRPEIEREIREDREVEAWRGELRTAFEEMAAKIRAAHAELGSARRQMDMAKLQNQRAQEQERRAREMAGLSNSMSSLGVALDAMNKETVRARAQTDALRLKADLFQGDTLDSDPNIAEALASVRGSSPVDGRSLSDRLAALKAGGAGGA